MIELIHLCKNYETPQGKVTAFSDISLRIEPGEIMGIIGESGAGKSSLVRCMNLLESPSSGTVRVCGETLTALDQSALRRARQRIGMIFQHFNLLSSRTVYNNAALPLILRGQKKQEYHEKVLGLLALVGLADKKDCYPATLSGGEKQRVAIARALVTDPDVLLSDEATSALDPQNTRAILQLLQTIRKTLGVTIVVITHEMDVIKCLCDRVGILEKGKLIKVSSVLDLFSHPHADLSSAFLNTYLERELPPFLHKTLIAAPEGAAIFPVWRLFFRGAVTSTPLIAYLVREFNVTFNILQAAVDYLQEEPFGILVGKIQGDLTRLAAATAYLEAQGVTVEVIGYVD